MTSLEPGAEAHRGRRLQRGGILGAAAGVHLPLPSLPVPPCPVSTS